MIARRFALIGNLLVGAVLLLVVWALLVYVASRPALKTLIDLTPQRVNSVDPVTVELLQDLRAKQAVIEFHLFAPPQDGGGGSDPAMTQSLAIRRRLVDLTRLLLVRYAYLGGESVKRFEYDFYREALATRDAAGRFDYKIADAEVLVVAVRMPGKEPRHRKLSLVSDLAVIDLPNAGVPMPGGASRMPVPVLKDYRGEQGISSALKSLLVQGIPVAYLLQDYSPGVDFSTAAAGGYNAFVAALVKSGFEVKTLSLRADPVVPADAAVVIVLEPRQEFADRDALALFRYVQGGGRLFLNYVWGGVVEEWNPTGGKLGELLGYELSEQPVFHLIPDPRGRSQSGGFDGDNDVGKLRLLCNKGHPTTRRLAESGRPLEFAGAREVRERRGAPTTQRREALLSTNEYGWLAVPGPDGFPDNRAPKVQLRPFEVAMAIEVPPEGDAKTARAGHAVVIGGMFANNAGMQAGFGDFAVNVCNWMAERKELLDLPGDAYQARHLDVQLPQLLRISDFLIYGVPGTFLLLGIVVVLLRRRQ